MTTYPRDLSELALAHTVGSAVIEAYLRSDLLRMRRALQEDWARYCASPSSTGSETAALLQRGHRRG
jgi:hypothetical protein